LQTFVLARFGRAGRLQERAIRRELRFQQEWHLQHARPFGQALTNTLLLGKRVLSHGPSLLRSFSRKRRDNAPLVQRLAEDIASPLGWWLATTSLWRTT